MDDSSHAAGKEDELCQSQDELVAMEILRARRQAANARAAHATAADETDQGARSVRVVVVHLKRGQRRRIPNVSGG